MTEAKLGQHISQQFNKELEALQLDLLHMGNLVKQQLNLAMQSVMSREVNQAEQSIKLFNQVDTCRLALDQSCIEMLALRQPAASDLKFIVTVIKIIYELEMVSELAETIAKLAIQLSVHEGRLDNYQELLGLSESVQVILNNALVIFAEISFSDSSQMTNLDHLVQQKFSGVSRQSISLMMQDPKHISRTIDILRIARALERIGDHAYHIQEEILYMIKAQDVEAVKA